MLTTERLDEIRLHVREGQMFGSDAPDLLAELDRLREAIRKHRESWAFPTHALPADHELWATIGEP